jgi:hypothetical protein
MKTNGRSTYPHFGGSCGGGRDSRTLPQPGRGRRVSECVGGFHPPDGFGTASPALRLGKFIRFDPADLDAFAEVKEPLSGPDPTVVTQVWRRSRRLS